MVLGVKRGTRDGLEVRDVRDQFCKRKLAVLRLVVGNAGRHPDGVKHFNQDGLKNIVVFYLRADDKRDGHICFLLLKLLVSVVQLGVAELVS